MYRKVDDTKNRINLIWQIVIADGKPTDYHPAHGYVGGGRNAITHKIEKGFGGTDFALKFLNRDDRGTMDTDYGPVHLDHEPEFVRVHGTVSVVRPFSKWFEIEEAKT